MRWIFKIGLTLVTFAVMGAGALTLVPTDGIVRLAAERVEAATGRALTVSGPVHVVIWPHVGLRAEGIALADAPWAGPEPVVRARAMNLVLDWRALALGTVAFDSVVVEGAAIRLTRRADGTGNWTMAGGAGLPVRRITLRDADVSFVDRGSGGVQAFDAVDLTMARSGPQGGALLAASALTQGIAFEAEARVADAAALASGSLTPVAFALRAGGSTVTLDGRVDLAPVSFEGALRAESIDGMAAIGAFGVAPPVLPKGFGRDRLSLSARATLAPGGGLHLRGMEATLDGNVLSGGVDVLPGQPRPRVTASLTTPALYLPWRVRGAEGWRPDPIDLSPLFGLDGAMTLTTGPVAIGPVELDRVDATVALEDGRAVVTLREALGFGGVVSGEGVLNGRGDGSARARLTARGVEMAGAAGLTGRADLDIDLLGLGDDMASLMGSLGGTVSIRMERGAVTGVDIPAMVRDLDAARVGPDRVSPFARLSVTATVTDGVARSDDLSLSIPPLSASGAGLVDLGPGEVAGRIETVAPDGSQVPLLIDGPWGAPVIRPDLKWVARRELALRARAEAVRIEARVQAEADAAARRADRAAREKLAAELGVAVDALGSREAIEAAIRETVGAQLMDALEQR